MPRTDSEKPEQERLFLDGRLLEMGPPELRQPLAYVLHLRSQWRPEGRAKLIVPTSWMAFLAFADDKCGGKCAGGRRCPFRNVRFENDAETCLAVPGEELPREIVSQLLTDFGPDGCLATLIPRAFEGIPRTRLRSDTPATFHVSQNTPQNIDFALVPGYESSSDAENSTPESSTQCLLLGMKEPTQMQRPPSASFDLCSEPHALSSIPEELTTQGQLHLTLLASLIKRGAVEVTTGSDSFPEWLVLFGLIYDAHHVRVAAYVSRRHPSDVIECVGYIVDRLSFRSTDTSAPITCELALARLRLLLALTTLRRHIYHLSKSLFVAAGSRDGIRRPVNRLSFLSCSETHDQHSSESLYRRASLGSSQHCGSEYSTCPSSVHARELNDIQELSSLCRSIVSSVCSACLSSLDSASTSNFSCSEDSKYTNSDYMEPCTISLSQGRNESAHHPKKLTEIKRQGIIAWARKVIPTEHPVKDTYRMVIRHSHLRQQKVASSISGTRR